MHHQQRQSSMVSPCSKGSSSSSCPLFRSVFVWSVTLLLIYSSLNVVDAQELTGEKSYVLQCKGTYNASLFARLNRICDDCYNLYRSAQLYNFCMENCFTSVYFKGCVDALYLEDKLPEIKKAIMYLHGAEVPDYR